MLNDNLADDNVDISSCDSYAAIVSTMEANRFKTGVGSIGILDPASNLKSLLPNPLDNYTAVQAKYISNRIVQLYAIALWNAGIYTGYISNHDDAERWSGWTNVS